MVGKNTNFAGTVNIVTSCKPAFRTSSLHYHI